jgi:peroxiredoxin
MAKAVQGQKLTDFTYQTAFEQGLRISDAVTRVEGKTAIAFLRYYGCTLCQYNLHNFLSNYDAIMATGGQLMIVFQSDPELVAEQTNDTELPFDIICDKDQELYQLFEIGAAASKRDLFDDEGRAFLEKIKAEGFMHGAYEGNETQLPALFIVDHDLTLDYVHYGKLANDMPDALELADLLK